jgi:hypothetical protein
VILTKVKCWYVGDAIYDIEQVSSRPPSLNLVKKSILKSGYRAYCLNDRAEIETSLWYRSYLTNEKINFYIEGSGIYKLVNLDLVENEFYFEKSNLPSGYRPWIFYSWQSDHNASRSHVKDAIDHAISIINSRHPKVPLELVESTRPEDGAGNIVEAIKSNIDKCLMAIFDVTNVCSIDSTSQNAKSYPNANVVFELGYALSRKNEEQVLIVKRNRSADFGNDLAPFDFSQNRRINYDRPAQIKNDLSEAVVSYFERLGFMQ